MKKIAILQSNYLPWKGVFDMINSVDEFVFLEDVQYTSRDWRNIEEIYLSKKWTKLSVLNIYTTKMISEILGISTSFRNSIDLHVKSKGCNRLIDICNKLDADIYIYRVLQQKLILILNYLKHIIFYSNIKTMIILNTSRCMHHLTIMFQYWTFYLIVEIWLHIIFGDGRESDIMKTLSVVIPVYNSMNSIEKVVDRVLNTTKDIEGFHCEIILINDGSKDNSLEVCKAICLKRKQVKLINLSKNFGQHNAILAGLAIASGIYIIRLDDDLQTPPEEIKKLVDEIENSSYDVVFGFYKKKKHSWIRNIGTKMNDRMASYLLSKPKNVKLSSFCIAKRFVIDEIVKYTGPFPHMGGLTIRTTANIGNIVVCHHKREEGKSNYSWKKLISLWMNGFTNFSVKPLRISGIVGGILAFTSFILIVWLIIRKLMNPQIQMGWTSLIIAITFLGGIQLISIGIIGEYIGRIYLTVNQTPQYVIKEAINITCKNEHDRNDKN